MNDTSAVPVPLQCEDTRRKGEGSHLKGRKQALTRQHICLLLDLGLPSLPICEKYMFVF